MTQTVKMNELFSSAGLASQVIFTPGIEFYNSAINISLGAFC